MYGRSVRTPKQDPNVLALDMTVVADAFWTARDPRSRTRASVRFVTEIESAAADEREIVATKFADLICEHEPEVHKASFEESSAHTRTEMMSEPYMLNLGHGILKALASDRLIETYGDCAQEFRAICGVGPAPEQLTYTLRVYEWNDARVAVDLSHAGFDSESLRRQVRLRFTSLLRDQLMITKNQNTQTMIAKLSKRTDQTLVASQMSDANWIQTFNRFIAASLDGASSDDLTEILLAGLYV
jgi:hypothetical protein